MNRNISLDILKLILAFMVVGIHSGFMDVNALSRYITVNGLFRIAVPIFFVINGFFFYSTLQAKAISKWFKRIIVLYTFWTFVYVYFWLPPEMNAMSLAKIIKTVLVGHNHLWYLPAMIGAAALLCVVKNFSTRLLFTSSIILFFAGVTIQYLGNYHVASHNFLDKALNTLWVYRNFIFFAFPFFCIGYLLKRDEFYKKITQMQAITISFIGLTLVTMESFINFLLQTKTEGFDIFLSLIVACPFIFLAALSTNIQGQSKSIALYSTAVYFIHPLFISLYCHYFIIDGTLLTFLVIATSMASAIALVKIDSRLKIML